jgi:hypothetical protein
MAAYWEKFHERNPDSQKQSSTRWHTANREQDRVRSLGRWRGMSHDEKQRHRLQRYGVTPEWFREQLVGQAARCAVCGEVMGPGRDTHVDHDHTTGRVRGLLCRNCNIMLGHAKDSAEILNKAVSYLERSS